MPPKSTPLVTLRLGASEQKNNKLKENLLVSNLAGNKWADITMTIMLMIRARKGKTGKSWYYAGVTRTLRRHEKFRESEFMAHSPTPH